MSTLYQLELDQTSVNCGMSYVIHLPDGRFLLIDGGYFTPGEDDRLFEFLTARSKGVPVIAGWFFSHAHQDHVGNFIQFIRKYRHRVVVEKMLYNFQPVDVSQVTGDWMSSDPATVKAFYETVDEYCSDVEQVTVRTGDHFTFEDVDLDVIFTHEELPAGRGSFNDHSTVLRATVGGQRILWLADVGKWACPVLLERPEALRCEIVQVSHHGIDNFDVLQQVYAATGAKVVLWPAASYLFVEKNEQAINHFVLHGLDGAEHFVSGYGTVELPLPYQTGTAIKHEKQFSLDRHPQTPAELNCDGSPVSPFRYITRSAIPRG